jgi:HPt (histidine-containing phosphotransfer) domain-containing protein
MMNKPMPTLIDLDMLTELYPAPEARRQFLRRAVELMQEDRLAMQDALTRHAYVQAGELAHRLQGSAAFLTGKPEQSAAILLPLGQAIKQELPADFRDMQATVMDYLLALESAIGQLIGD